LRERSGPDGCASKVLDLIQDVKEWSLSWRLDEITPRFFAILDISFKWHLASRMANADWWGTLFLWLLVYVFCFGLGISEVGKCFRMVASRNLHRAIRIHLASSIDSSLFFNFLFMVLSCHYATYW
jgi:hypothetical protein